MEPKTKKDALSNQSSEKLLSLMEYMSRLDDPIRISDLSKNLNMNISTLSRFLTTLISFGYVDQEQDTGRYYMTYKVCHIANNVTQRRDLRRTYMPYLRRVSSHFECTTNLIIRYNYSCIYLDVIASPQQVTMPLQRIGKEAPLYCTGAGKLLLQEFDDEMLEEYGRSVTFEPFTEHTVKNIDQLKLLIERSRMLGYAVDDEECEIGTRCLAVPVYDYTNQINAVISINGPTSLFTDDFISDNVNTLKSIAMELSRKLGYNL